MPDPRLGRQIATSPRCKICGHSARAEIEDAFQAARDRVPQGDGVALSQEALFRAAPERWGMKVTYTNVRHHFGRHFAPGPPKPGVDVSPPTTRGRLEDYIREHGIDPVMPDEFLENVVAISNRRALIDPGSITVEMGLKAVSEYTKRKTNESESLLMSRLAGSIGRVVIEAAAPKPEEIVVEAEEVPGG